VFGADYDKDMAEWLKERIDIIDCTGEQHLGVSLEAMKKCDGFIGFPSGLTVLAHQIGLPTIMFFPNEARHIKMLNTFNKAGSIEDGTWKGCTFPKTASQIVEWALNNDTWRRILS
jgi:ADP-heptose:LPS heptosyltransferase